MCAAVLALTIADATIVGTSGLAGTPLGHGTATDTVLTTAAATTVTVDGHGNGHGHGMSQYGARGAAIAGLSTAQILAFYYPGTTLATLPASYIRVLLGGSGPYSTVYASTPGLTLNGSAISTASTISRYRLAPYSTGIGLQQLNAASGSIWTWVKTGLPTTSTFGGSAGYIHVALADGTSTLYKGTISAVRSGSGVLTVNRLPLDGYAAGVTPREMPASWSSAAVRAQSVAARTYGRNAVESHASSPYDICDTTQCQVYGGYEHFAANGSLLWTDDTTDAGATSNQVLHYAGHTIFAQFSASNGGWTVAVPGFPYLVAKADPYDNAASGDPWLNWHYTVPLSQIASHYGLSQRHLDPDHPA